MNAAPRISFVIPVRNGSRHLRRLLGSIMRTGTAADVPFEIVVGDHGSTDDTAAVARVAGARVVNVDGGRASTVRNVAAAQARGDLLAFIDADHELDSGWCATAVAQFDDRAVAAVGAQYHAPAEGTWVQRTYDRFRRHGDAPHDTEWLPSGNLVVRRDVFEQLGGFDETLETCEDVDFSQRLWAIGARMRAVPALRSTHFGDPSTLRALFFGELWRGRDNLRVTMKGRLTARSLVSLLIPVATLGAVTAIVVGAVMTPFGGANVALAGAMTLGGLIVVRALPLMQVRDTPRAPAAAAQALAVSTVYNMARAFSLVVPAGHQLRRSA